MSNETSLASQSGAIPAWLRAKALKARYAASKVWKLALNGVEGDPLVKGNITKAGDRVTFQIFPSISVGDISTADGTLANQVITPTQATITVDKWKGAVVDVVDIAGQQSVLNFDEELADAFGKSISAAQDISVAALASGLTVNTPFGDNNSAFTDPGILYCQRVLDDGEVPKEDRNWVICPSAHSDILAIDKFTLANTTGFSKGVQVDNGRIVGLYGTPVTVTSVVLSSGGARYNYLAHRECLGIVMQREFKMEKFARTKFTTPYAANALYGVGELRDNHGIAYLTRA